MKTEQEGAIVSMNEAPLAQIAGAEINQQIATAKAYPRDENVFMEKLMKRATYDEETALACIYTLERTNDKGEKKQIIGPSVRFAEICVSLYKNLRSDTRIIGELENRFIVAQSTFYDLENNVGIRFETMRRITRKDGRKFGDDLIQVTSNAAASIAFRNGVTKAIPRVLWMNAFDGAVNLAKGDVKTLPERRLKMLQKFLSFGIDNAQVYGLLGVKGLEEITIDHLIEMHGVYNMIREGEKTAREAFDPENWPRSEGGKMTPSEPVRSEFTRTDPEKAVEQKTETKAGEPAQAATVVQSTATTAEPAKEEPKQKTATEIAYDEWFQDALAELKAQTGIRDLTDTYERLIRDVMGDERMRQMTTVFETRHKEILDSTHVQRRKTGK